MVNTLGEGVARRGDLHQRNEVSTMEVRSDRTPQTRTGTKGFLQMICLDVFNNFT